jgi:hypothetical protein
MEGRVFAIGSYFFGQDEAEGVPHADAGEAAWRFGFGGFVDYGAAGLLVGEHFYWQ